MRVVAIQRMRLIVPPTLAELLEDEIYARYFRRNPRVPDNPLSRSPWQIIARRHPDAPGATWGRQLMPTYADAHRRARTMLGDRQWEDVAICSRAIFFKPPVGFTWSTGRYSWCGRCRRPTLFREMKSHPILNLSLDAALRHAIMVSKETPERCYYCGVKQTSMPRYKPRGTR